MMYVMDSNDFLLIAAVWTVGILDFICYILFSSDPQFFIFGDLMTVILSVYVTIACFGAFRLHGAHSAQGKAIYFMLGGALTWLIADVAWAVQEVGFGLYSPLISPADIFYYLGYVFITLGFYHMWKFTKPSLKKRLPVVAVAVLAFILLYMIFIVPTVYGQDATDIEKIVTNFYVVADIIMVTAAALVLPLTQKSKISLAWTIIITGFIITAMGDVLFVYFADTYYSGQIFSILWDVGYIVVALGYFHYSKAVGSMLSRNETDKRDSYGVKRRRKKNLQ
jgi:hypothetical protein